MLAILPKNGKFCLLKIYYIIIHDNELLYNLQKFVNYNIDILKNNVDEANKELEKLKRMGDEDNINMFKKLFLNKN